MKSLSHVRLFVIPWTAAYQAPPSIGFSRQEYWSGVPSPSPSFNPAYLPQIFYLNYSVGHIYHSHRLWREAVEGSARTPLTNTCGHTEFPPETEQSAECFRMANSYEMCLEHLGQCLRSCSNYLGYHQ